jgi:hypothetical protein
MTLLGVATAGILAKRLNDDAFVAAIPAAFVVLGGTFLHSGQISAAIPAALLLAGHVKRSRTLLFAAVLLAIPWEPIIRTADFVPLACAGVAWLVWRFFNGNVAVALGAALASASFGIADNALIQRWMKADTLPQGLQLNPHDLAEVGWSIAVHAQYATHNPGIWLSMAPTVIGVFLLVLGASLVAWSKLPPDELEVGCTSPSPILA